MDPNDENNCAEKMELVMTVKVSVVDMTTLLNERKHLQEQVSLLQARNTAYHDEGVKLKTAIREAVADLRRPDCGGLEVLNMLEKALK